MVLNPDETIDSLCARYLASARAWTVSEDGVDQPLLHAVEENVPVAEDRRGLFRREIMNYVGALAIEGKKFEARTNDRLHAAFARLIERR